MKFVDYHVHSNNSCDGESTVLEMCRRAIELGIVEIGFSEHVDFEPEDWGLDFFNYEKYSSEVKSARELFGDELVVRKGVEVDYTHYFEDKIRDWLKDKRFDFVVGSVHYIDHEYINHRLVNEKDLSEVYNSYLDEITHSIESRLFDVIGHFGLVDRFLDNKRRKFKNFYWAERTETILEEIMKKRMHLEINTKGVSEIYGDTIPSIRKRK